MNMQVNIRNIRINSISTLGSLNVGKIIQAENRSTSYVQEKPDYEENELDVDLMKKMMPEELVDVIPID